MTNQGVDMDSEDVQELSSDFELFTNPYAGVETAKQQHDYMMNNLMLVQPENIALGTRTDQRLDRKTGQMVQKVVTESFQYIPVLQVLKLILTPQIRRLIDNETHSPDGILRGYQDGKQYKQHDLFLSYPNALRLQLYYDDIEITNPLGSKDQGQNCTSILHPFCTAIIVGLAMRTVVEWANYSPNKRSIVNPAEA